MNWSTEKSSTVTGDWRRLDPARQLQWRWSFARAHQNAGTQPQHWEDPAIHTALAYLRELNAAGTAEELKGLRRRHPEISEAHRIFADAGTLRDEVEARLLCQHVLAVSEITGIDMGVLLTYGTVFFDIFDGLAATGWLMDSVVRVHALHSEGVHESHQWKYWAVAGGPQVLELLIADSRGLPEPKIDDRHLLAEKFRFSLREYVTPSRDRAAMAAIIEEGCDRFGELWGCEPADRYERQALQMHMRTLRVAYGLSPKPRKFAQSVKHPKNKKSKQPHSTESRK